jgi:hypothetical protein
MKNFLNTINKGLFPFIIAFSALSVSASAAFYSVSGLSKLFAGASFEVIVMASSLEIAKLVIASLLYQYWRTINRLLRMYLTIAATVLVLITSMGIYGFLSAAYQETYSQLAVVENQKFYINEKIRFYQKDVNRYDEELERISANISDLSKAKSTSIQVRDTTSSTGFRNTISTTDIRLAQSRIQAEEANRKGAQVSRQIAADSLQKLQLEVLNLENNTEVAGELGPLKYLSNLTGASMDKIINILLLVIIFVFDPLAISLVVAANMAFAQAFPKKRKSVDEVTNDDYLELSSVGDDLFKLDKEKQVQEKLKNIEVNDLEVVKGKTINSKDGFLSKLDELDAKIIKDSIIEEQKKQINTLKTELDKANEEINELDRAAIKMVDSLKHLDDYLRHHGKAYSPLVADWNEIKLGFAEEDDYIEPTKPKENDDIITY